MSVLWLDLSRYVLSIESASELEDYLLQLLNPEDEEHLQFIKELIQRWKPKDGASVKVYQKEKEEEAGDRPFSHICYSSLTEVDFARFYVGFFSSIRCISSEPRRKKRRRKESRIGEKTRKKILRRLRTATKKAALRRRRNTSSFTAPRVRRGKKCAFRGDTPASVKRPSTS